MNKKKHLVTAALPYANGPVHIGHMAGCYLPADIYVRYQRAKGEDVLFVCGSDEHGVAITIKAKKEGITPQQVVDKYNGIIKDAFANFGITFDIYSRTSNPTHHETAQAFFKDLYDKEAFEEKETEQYYDVEAQQFLADRYIIGTCPVCGNPNAYGDQCENCGTSLDPKELKDVRSALSDSKPELRTSKNWFLNLGDLAEKDGFKNYSKKVAGWKSNVKGQFNSWINQGLHARAMTRDLDWGIKVPIEGVEGKVLYVWFDAPIGYISATKEYFEQKGKPDEWKDWWKDEENTNLIHFIGKDNIVFHTLIFPMMLLEHGGFVLPTQVPANEFLNLEGQKISTSRNWAIWLHEYLEDFPNRTDELRYVLTSIAPETKDADFTWRDYQLKVNSELVAILGNFVNRALVLTHKFYDGVVPTGSVPIGNTEYNQEPLEDPLVQKSIALHQKARLDFEHFENNIQNFKFREAQVQLMNIAREGNKYLAETEPWKLIKQNPEQTAFVIKNCLNLCLQIANVAAPILPATAQRIKEQLNVADKTFAYGIDVALESGHTINKAEHLFKNIDDTEIEKQLEKLEANKKENLVIAETTVAPAKPEIVFDDFAKMDIRIGTILEAERVPKTDKLMTLLVDTGVDKRTVVSGIAQHFEAADIIGKQVSILINLAPRKLKGIESQGMILMAEDAKGKLHFVSPNDGVENGSGVS